MSASALVPIITKLYGDDRKAYYVTADYNWGHTIEKSIVDSVGCDGIGYVIII